MSNLSLRRGLAILGAALLCAATTSALAATITVTNTADSGPGTLRAALTNAANGDVINATGVSGTILLTSGQLLVTSSVTILGPGPGNLALNGNYPNTTNRVLYINPDLVVTIAGLTITNGFVSDPDDEGAGIHNDHSTLTVSNCVFSGNQGGFGGGIFNDGYQEGNASTLLVSSSTFISNSASYAGGAIGIQATGGSSAVSVSSSTFTGNNSGPFYGGAIMNDGSDTTNAILVVSNSTFSSNWTPEGGSGGAIVNIHLGTTIVSSSTFTNNMASFGGALYNGGNNSGNATLTVNNCTISGNSANGGGGLYNSGYDGVATTRVLNSTISGNSATDPNGGGGALYNDGGFSTNSAPLIVVLNSTISGNSGAYGGGIFNDGRVGIATVTITNCTLRANSANVLGGLVYNDGSSSGNTMFSVVASTVSSNSAADTGGAIYNEGIDGSVTVTMINTTVSGNSATNGGGIYNHGLSGSATLNLGSTILNAGASGSNIVNNPGTVISLGYNISSDDGGGFLTGIADQINTDPKLGPLQNNGGPTFTHALLTNSPAIDKGKNFSGLTTDQRGLPRPVDLAGVVNATGGDGSDIGAFEAQVAIIPTPIFLTSWQKQLNGPFQFSFTNVPGASFTVLTSTNITLPLANWTVLGPPMEISSGNFQYSDSQATNNPRAFYGVRSP